MRTNRIRGAVVDTWDILEFKIECSTLLHSQNLLELGYG